jgi:hypothetical protein
MEPGGSLPYSQVPAGIVIAFILCRGNHYTFTTSIHYKVRITNTILIWRGLIYKYTLQDFIPVLFYTYIKVL